MKVKAAVLTACLMAAAAGVQAADVHWEYGGKTGPSHWGELEAGFSSCKTGKHPLEAGLDLSAALPRHHAYYAYMGSLTTPPCSEDVHWQVLREPVEVSKGQLASFRKLYAMNARPIQPLNGRVVNVAN